MTVYVHPMTPCVPNKRWKWRENCHMVADTHEELMSLASRIGLRASWIQDPGSYREHFDLTPSKHTEAIEAGAVELSLRSFVEFIAKRRQEVKP